MAASAAGYIDVLCGHLPVSKLFWTSCRFFFGFDHWCSVQVHSVVVAVDSQHFLLHSHFFFLVNFGSVVACSDFLFRCLRAVLIFLQCLAISFDI